MGRTTYPHILKKYPTRESFIKALHNIRPELSRKTLINNWYYTRGPEKVIRIKPEFYKQLYEKYPELENFIREVQKQNPTMKRKILRNRWYKCKNKLQRINKYSIDDKEELDNFRRLLFDDIKKYKKPKIREYLLQYGFTPKQINKLEDDGELDETVV